MIQSFILDPILSDNTHSFLTSVDLFFQTKSSIRGVTVSICEMENGIPTSRILPFSSVHIVPEDINVSSTGSTATNVKFPSIVSVRNNQEYGLSIIPDGMDPDYKLWISRIGETDVSSGIAVNQDTNAGLLFTSTNGRTWTPYQTENLKFTLNIARFTASYGEAVFTTDDQEFLELTGTLGKFIPGELVYVQRPYEAGTMTFVKGSQTVNGTTTAFNQVGGLVSGDWVVADLAGAPQVMQVNEDGVISDTNLNMFVGPTQDGTSVSWYKTTVGTVTQYLTRNTEKLVLEKSSAKSGSVFADGDVIYGAESGASATISSVVSQKVSFSEPNIRRIDLPGTRIRMYSALSNGVSLEESYTPFNDSNYYFQNELMIPSKSQVIGGMDAAEFKFILENVTSIVPMDASPLLDYGASSMLNYQFVVNNDATGEETTNGNAVSRYVSKLSTLATGMDAEDFVCYLTAYRPVGTDIKVYAKFISESDSRNPYSVGWTELELQSEFGFYSSSTDMYDFKEFKFKIPSEISVNDDSASFDGTSFQYTFDGVTYPNYKKFVVKIVMLSDTYSKAPRVADVRGIALI